MMSDHVSSFESKKNLPSPLLMNGQRVSLSSDDGRATVRNNDGIGGANTVPSVAKQGCKMLQGSVDTGTQKLGDTYLNHFNQEIQSDKNYLLVANRLTA